MQGMQVRLTGPVAAAVRAAADDEEASASYIVSAALARWYGLGEDERPQPGRPVVSADTAAAVETDLLRRAAAGVTREAKGGALSLDEIAIAHGVSYTYTQKMWETVKDSS